MTTPHWDKLLDQLTFDDMDNLIANGGYRHARLVKSVGKIQPDRCRTARHR